MKPLRVFISCVSSEFASERDQLIPWLKSIWTGKSSNSSQGLAVPNCNQPTSSDIELEFVGLSEKERIELESVGSSEDKLSEFVIHRNNINSGAHSLLDRLDDLIQSCHLVFHLVGTEAGFPASPVSKYTIRNVTKPQLAGAIATHNSHPSFTHWEGYFALLRNTPLVICKRKSIDTSDPTWANFKHWNLIESTGHVTNVEFSDFKNLTSQLETICKKQLRLCWGFQTASLVQSSNHSPHLFDRESAYRKLDECYEWAKSSKRPIIVMVTGQPGSGKTSLVQKWISDKIQNGISNSFSSMFCWKNPVQGPPVAIIEAEDIPNRPSPLTRQLFEQASRFFADVGESTMQVNENLRGDFCGDAFRKLGGLVVLDGMEAFQRTATGKFGNAPWQDKELLDFISKLQNIQGPVCPTPTMLIMTSYLPAWDASISDPHQVNIHLEQLKIKDAIDCLKSIQVDGKKLIAVTSPTMSEDQVFEEAARSVNCHPLAIRLLGCYLIACFNGKLHVFPNDTNYRVEHTLTVDDSCLDSPTRHVEIIVKAWMNSTKGISSDNNRTLSEKDAAIAEIALLEILTIFQRPVSRAEIGIFAEAKSSLVLRFWQPLSNSNAFQAACRRLSGVGLIINDVQDRLSLAHHSIGDFILKNLQDSQNISDWDDANAFLYNKCLAAAVCISEEEQVSDSPFLQRPYMDLLLLAVSYGARSKLTLQAAWSTCLSRMRNSKDPRFPTWSKVAAKCDDLAVLSNFYSNPWKTVRFGIENWQQNHNEHDIELLNETGYVLQKLTRYDESVEAFQVAVLKWQEQLRIASKLNDRISIIRGLIRDSVLLGKSFYMHMRLNEFRGLSAALETLLKELENAVNNNLNNIDVKEQRGALLRLIDGYAFLAWCDHLEGKSIDEVAHWETYNEHLDQCEKIDQSPFIRSQKMFTHTRCLIECGETNKAMVIIQQADQICKTEIKQGGKTPEQLETDILFNGVLRGMARNSLDFEVIDAFNEARSDLESILNRSYQADLLECWLFCQLELAKCHMGNIQNDTSSIAQASHYLGHVETFLKHTPIPRIRLEWLILNCKLALKQKTHANKIDFNSILLFADEAVRLASNVNYARKQQEASRLRDEIGGL